ncbi:mechanosensitive ion channel domain-containing protein [Helicobacter sp. 10-6591]|uniref:small-conductance mechanosensitive channel MscS n=1 Tax=Helicobacter sp. 10-6591 TaxID=2004998 RepID=UPI000DCB0AD3|nr:mechanosensitive ion channel domain-containing protein [Helicobacter sp. 10-6591]RAX54144.1 mechanosensitive ion channel protein [Helicobacter sp. 10-6591]
MHEVWENFKAIVVGVLPNIQTFGLVLFKVTLLLVVGYYFSRFLAKRVRKSIESRDIVLSNFLSQVVFIGVNVAVIIAALGTLGVQTNSIIAVLGTAGVAIALGLKDSLSSVASGIILIILRPFANGDVIELGSITGKVETINLFNTTLRLPDGKLAIIPNANISKANVINSTDISKRRLDITFGVGYESNTDAVKLVVINILENNPCVDLKKGYFIGLDSFGESSINFLLRFWIDVEYGLLETKASILESLKVNLEANGIEIPFNKVDVNILTPKAESSQQIPTDKDILENIVFVPVKTDIQQTDFKQDSQPNKDTRHRIFDKIAHKLKISMKDNGN